MTEENSNLNTWRSGKLAIALVVMLALALVTLAYIISRMPYEVAYKSRTEEGFLERSTVVLYGVAFIICLIVVFVNRWRTGFYVATLLLAFSLREMDFHIRPTTTDRVEKITSTRYWRSGDVGLLEKLIILIILIAIATTIVKYLRGSSPRWLADLKRGRPYAISVAGFGLFMLTGFMIDNQLSMDALDNPVVLFLSLVEECIEVGIPIMACIALVQWAKTDCPKPVQIKP